MGKTNLGRVTLVPRGAYNNEASYKRLDVVEYEGSSYLFLKDSTGIIPTADGEVTMLLAKRGKDFAYEDFTPEQLAALKGADGNDGVNGSDGTKGDKGDPGKGLTILGYLDTPDLLNSVSFPSPGDAYGVGTAAPYDIYVFDGVTNDWVNNGKLAGGSEGGGNVVLIPIEVVELSNTSTSEEILNAFGGKDAFVSIATQLEKGSLPIINANGLFSQVGFFTAHCDVESDTYIIAFRVIDSSIFKINGYKVPNGMLGIVLINDTASVEILDIPGDGFNSIAIPDSVLNIGEDSTSEQIIAALGGIYNIRSIIIKSQSGGNFVYVLTAGNTRVPITGNLYNFNGSYDSPSFEIMLDILYLTTKRVLTLRFNQGVAVVEYRYNSSLIADSDLVSDPAVGGTDKPASAEAVKQVSEEIMYKKYNFPHVDPDHGQVVLLWKYTIPKNQSEPTFKSTIIGFFSGMDTDDAHFSMDVKCQLFLMNTRPEDFIFDGFAKSSHADVVRLVMCRYNGELYVAFDFHCNSYFPVNNFIGYISQPALFNKVIYERIYDETILNQEIKDSIMPITGFFPAYNS